jgi:hypothetical protein
VAVCTTHQPSTRNCATEWVHDSKQEQHDIVKYWHSRCRTHPTGLTSCHSVPWCQGLSTINAQHYCGPLCVLHTAIKRKHPGMLTRGVIVWHNTHLHVACTVQGMLLSVHWKVLEPSPLKPRPVTVTSVCLALSRNR